MCQLLGMNCASPTDFRFSLKGFCQRGGATDVHRHGWGAAMYEGSRGGLRTFHDTQPACQSPLAQLLLAQPVLTHNMMAHIRYATRGEVSLENVHPFSRELWGIQFAFAHNGDCPTFSSNSTVSEEGLPAVPLLGKCKNENDVHYWPVGETDSEAVFCAVLNALKAEFPNAGRGDLPSLPVLFSFLQSLCQEIITTSEGKSSNSGCDGTAETGDSASNESHDADAAGGKMNHDPTIFNFLLTCGQYCLFAYSWPGSRPGSKVWNGLHYIIREPPFSTASLLDLENETVDFAAVTTPDDRVAVITTKPLTNEYGRWIEIQRGELLLFNHGKVYKCASQCSEIDLAGRGLTNRCHFRKCKKQNTSCPQEAPASPCAQSPATATNPQVSDISRAASPLTVMVSVTPTPPSSGNVVTTSPKQLQLAT